MNFPYFLCKRLTRKNNEKLLYQFRKYKITKEQISSNKSNTVLLVRPSMKIDIDHIPNVDGGNLIYSLWEGYLKKENTKKFIEYLVNKQFKLYKVHTSGHADIETLKKMADAIKPKFIVPIHTFKGSEYKNHFNCPVKELRDGQEVVI